MNVSQADRGHTSRADGPLLHRIRGQLALRAWRRSGPDLPTIGSATVVWATSESSGRTSEQGMDALASNEQSAPVPRSDASVAPREVEARGDRRGEDVAHCDCSVESHAAEWGTCCWGPPVGVLAANRDHGIDQVGVVHEPGKDPPGAWPTMNTCRGACVRCTQLTMPTMSCMAQSPSVALNRRSVAGRDPPIPR